jgi:hypothetical protein
LIRIAVIAGRTLHRWDSRADENRGSITAEYLENLGPNAVM